MVFSIVVFLAKMSLSGLGMCCLNRGYITCPRGDTKVLFKCWKIAAYFPSSWRDVEPSKPGFDVWMKFLNNSKSYSVFFFVVGFSCSSTNSVPRLWSRQTCLAAVYNRLKTLFRLAKDQRKNSKKTIQTTENQKCALTARKNTVSWLVKNDATHVG